MAERSIADSGGAIVFDPEVAPQVGSDWFEPAYWRARGDLRVGDGGRGGVLYVTTPGGECVLRHYRRGGAVARLLGDRYLWRGRDRSRGFAEFRLLQRLSQIGLPVPRVVAARCQRAGWHYTADLMTQVIAAARTMAQHLTAGSLDAALAQRIGATIAQFHRHGVFHADLNAHNVLVNVNGIYLIDFDRGDLRAPAAPWQRANLARLRRSVVKLGAARAGEQDFERGLWAAVLDGYSGGMPA